MRHARRHPESADGPAPGREGEDVPASDAPDPAGPAGGAAPEQAQERAPEQTPSRGGLRHSLRAFRHRDYLIFWLGALASNTGTWLSNLTVPYVLYRMTGSALWVGLVSVAQFAPGILLSPVGGILADRYRRKRVLLTTQSGMAVAAVLMWAAWVLGWHEPVLLLALVCLTGLFHGLNVPSWQSFLSDLVPRQDLHSAVTLNSLQFNAARSVGPAIAGVLLAALGPAWAFLLNAGSFLCVLGALLLVRPAYAASRRHAPEGGVVRQLTGAFAYIRRQPGIIVGLVISVLVGVLGNPLFQLTVVFAESVFRVDAVALGLMNAALGVGAVIAAPIVTGWRGLRLSQVARWALVTYGAAIAAFGAAPHYLFGVAALVVVGGCFLAVVSTVNTATQLIVADHMRGRVVACRSMLYTASFPVGGMLQGALADWFGVRASVVGAGATMLLAALVLMVWRGRVRLSRLDDPHDESAPARVPVAS